MLRRHRFAARHATRNVATAIAWLALGATAAFAQPAQPAPPSGQSSGLPFLAPHYQPIRTDIGFGGAALLDQKAYGGCVTVEPKLNIRDNVAVGARVDATIAGGGKIGAPGSDDVSLGMSVIVATLLKGDFFLTQASVRPWVGLGLGGYTMLSQSVSTSPGAAMVHQKGGTYFGAAPQIGIELGGFRLSATYNAILAADVEVTQDVGGVKQTSKYSQNYLTVEIGFRTGGKRI